MHEGDKVCVVWIEHLDTAILAESVGARLKRRKLHASVVPLFVCIGFFIDNISINNLVQCAMCTPKLAMRRSEGMMLNMST